MLYPFIISVILFGLAMAGYLALTSKKQQKCPDDETDNCSECKVKDLCHSKK